MLKMDIRTDFLNKIRWKDFQLWNLFWKNYLVTNVDTTKHFRCFSLSFHSIFIQNDSDCKTKAKITLYFKKILGSDFTILWHTWIYNNSSKFSHLSKDISNLSNIWYIIQNFLDTNQNSYIKHLLKNILN